MDALVLVLLQLFIFVALPLSAFIGLSRWMLGYTKKWEPFWLIQKTLRGIINLLLDGLKALIKLPFTMLRGERQPQRHRRHHRRRRRQP